MQAETVHPFGFKYNPLKNCWSTIRPMLRERCRFTLTPIKGDNKLYAIGGSKSTCGSSNGDDGGVEDIDDFPMANVDPQQNPAAGQDERIGFGGEVYNAKSDKWYPIAPMPSVANLSQHAALSLTIKNDVKIAILENENDHCYTKGEKELATDEVEEVIFVSGGHDTTILNSNDHQPETMNHIMVYNVHLNKWLGQVRTTMPKPRVDHVMLGKKSVNSIVILMRI